MNTEKAIDLLDNLIGMVDDNQENDYDSAFHMAIDALKAQSDGDTISRKQAIDALDKIFPADPMRNDYTQGITCGAALATEYIKQLPSAQPETCDTCKHGYFGDTQCDNCCVRYPSHYERRTDG